MDNGPITPKQIRQQQALAAAKTRVRTLKAKQETGDLSHAEMRRLHAAENEVRDLEIKLGIVKLPKLSECRRGAGHFTSCGFGFDMLTA